MLARANPFSRQVDARHRYIFHSRVLHNRPKYVNSIARSLCNARKGTFPVLTPSRACSCTPRTRDGARVLGGGAASIETHFATQFKCELEYK